MQNENSKSEEHSGVLRWITALGGLGVGVVALLYVCGYLAHIVYFRLLGLEVNSQPLNYLRFAGDYLVSFFISLPQLLQLFSTYWRNLIADCLWSTLVSCVLLIGLAASTRVFLPRWKKLRTALVCFVIVLGAAPVFVQERYVLQVRDVLQPITPDNVVGEGRLQLGEKARPLQGRLDSLVSSYEAQLRLGKTGQEFDPWSRWFAPSSPNTEQQRTNSYLALLFLNILYLCSAAFAAFRMEKGLLGSIVRVEFVLTGLLFFLLFPCVYATLGRSFVFPVVVLKLADEDQDEPAEDAEDEGQKNVKPKTKKHIDTHPVFLIYQDETELVVYDRLNLLQLKRLPRSRILEVKQLYRSSPFQNCAEAVNEKGVPCEALWIKEERDILDF